MKGRIYEKIFKSANGNWHNYIGSEFGTGKNSGSRTDYATTGKSVKKGGYVKKKVYAYNLKLEKVTKVEKGVRYYVYKKCNIGYSYKKVKE